MQFPNFDPMTDTYLGTFMMNAESVTDSTNYAAFGQVMIPFFKDQFELTLGGRYQHIDKEIDLETYFLPIDQSGTPIYSLSGEKDWNVFLPKFAFTYRLNENWNTYASYSEGYMPGGFNYFSTSRTVDDNSFEPQTFEKL